MQRVRLRVNSGVHAHTHAFLATAHEDQKFGIALGDAADAVARIRSHAGLDFIGLHCHIGSQIFGSDGFAESAARLLAVHSELLAGGPVPELNLGGGFGIAYTTHDDPSPIGELADRIAEVVAAGCATLGIPVPVVAFEPGRSIIGTAGFTLYTVGTTKDVLVSTADDGVTAVRRYVSVDGGMSDNARPALYGADYSVRIAEPGQRQRAGPGPDRGQALRERRHRRRRRLSSRRRATGRPARRPGHGRILLVARQQLQLPRAAAGRRRSRRGVPRDRARRDRGRPAGARRRIPRRSIRMIEYRNLRVALLGAGSVGSQVAKLLLEHGDELAARVGASLESRRHRRARRERET